MENYKDLLGAIIRDREAADKKAREDLSAAQKANGDLQRAFLDPIRIVVGQLNTPEVLQQIYVFDHTTYPDVGVGSAGWKISAKNLYAAFNGVLWISYGTNWGKPAVHLVWGRNNTETQIRDKLFAEPVEAIPEILSTIAGMIRHR